MKALKSPLARQVLADPDAAWQLRRFLASKSATHASGVPAPQAAVVIELQHGGEVLRLTPRFVPKAH